jgi:hypothetical protein
MIILVLGLVLGGHHDVVLENAAVCHQSAVFKRDENDALTAVSDFFERHS